jgi:hypothetical protein
VNYEIHPNPTDKRISALLSSLDFWIADEVAIQNDKEKVQQADRISLCAK